MNGLRGTDIVSCPRRLFGENFSSEVHTSSGTSLSLIAVSPSFTAYLEKLYKETSLNPFGSCVPISRKGKVLDSGVFLLLGSLVRAMESLQMLSP